MEYATIRQLHIGCASLSITFFVLRWGMDMRAIAWRQQRWLRILPHANDAVLLSAAIALATMSRQYPWQLPWLGTKVILLLLYIALGKMALDTAQDVRRRALWGVLALMTVFTIAGIAITRNPIILF